MNVDQKRASQAADLMRQRAAAASNVVGKLSHEQVVLRIQHSDRWRPAVAYALAQALEDVATRDDDEPLLADLHVVARLYLGIHE